ncbi:THUMP domain-containing protein 2 isoform X2 [Tiliqua scincoides]|uniref:THUMP domain-containing protein 2 isoform X2 n=1 Tax=Tiliqua scincoides TaxID=71010 RepID=UPI0034636A67
MAAGGPGKVAPSVRYFCTAGRGLEPFLVKEVQARLEATQVEYILGKVFFTTSAELSMLRKLKSAERLFLLLNKYPPVSISRNKGKVIHDIQKLVNENPKCWLDIITLWRSLHHQVKQENVCHEYPDLQKRKLEEETAKNKRQKREQVFETFSAETQIEDQERCDTLKDNKDHFSSGSKPFLKENHETVQKIPVESSSSFSFRVSCRCSGALAKIFTAQEMGRIIGITLMKHLGWKADLRNPNIEIFVHLNDICFVIGIPVFRLPLASRTYINTAGLRSTIAWSMASLGEIKPGAFVLDPTCGLGTILLEAATEWPSVHYLGTDISDSQLEGAYLNIKAAGFMDKIELLKASVTDIPFGKKFKITKDMKLLPDVFQEISRVLCVGGIAVLLLSQEFYKRLSSSIASSFETENCISTASTSDCVQSLAVSTELKTNEKSWIPRTILPSVEDAGRENIRNKTTLASLELIESFEVSLGKTDAFICKYKKMTAASENI